ncbi:hypothetical protein LPJ56_003467, partial [Coemansia sp. RSA 2599]
MSGGPASSPVLGNDSDMEDFVNTTNTNNTNNSSSSSSNNDTRGNAATSSTLGAGTSGVDEYNTLPETPAPFSPPPFGGPRMRQASRAPGGMAVASSSPRLGFSDFPSTPGGGLGFGGSSQLMSG